MKVGRPIDLSHPDEIEVRRLEASTPDETAEIKAELERRGFSVIVRESCAAGSAAALYHADIFAEKRSVPSAAELAARAADEVRQAGILRRDYRLLWIGLGIVAVVLLLLLAFLLGPVAWLLRQIF